MKGGKLTEALAFDAPSDVPDGYGGVETTWAEQFATRGRFIHGKGTEKFDAGKMEGHHPVTVEIRSNANSRAVTTDYRMRDTRNSKTFNVVSAHVQPDRRWIELTAIEGAPV